MRSGPIVDALCALDLCHPEDSGDSSVIVVMVPSHLSVHSDVRGDCRRVCPGGDDTEAIDLVSECANVFHCWSLRPAGGTECDSGGFS